VFLERFLNSHSPTDIFLHLIIGFDKAGQKRNDFEELLLGNDDYAICGIAEDQVSRSYGSAVNLQRNLDGMRFRFCSCANDRGCSGPDLYTNCVSRAVIFGNYNKK
jgi:hypothetical protein